MRVKRRVKLIHHNAVVIKGERDKLTVLLDPDVSFADIKKQLIKRINKTKHFYEGAMADVSFTGRDLSEEEEQELLDIILSETNLKVPNLKLPYPFDEANEEVDEKEKSIYEVEDFEYNGYEEEEAEPVVETMVIPEELPVFRIPNFLSKPAPAPVAGNVNDTKFFRGTLRSGQRIYHHGSIVIMGDTNPGSEVVADGHIIVMGTLKGIAHAGAKGNKNCFVSAIVFLPMQLRIGYRRLTISRNSARIPATVYINEKNEFCITQINT